MSLRTGSLLLCLLGLLAASSANAASTALVSVNGGAYVAIPAESLGAEDYYCAGTAGCSNSALTGTGYSLEVNVILTPYLDTLNDIAPNIGWDFHAVNDTGAALSLSFIFYQDIDPISAPGGVNTSYRLGTTNGGGTTGQVNVAQLPPQTVIPTDADGDPEIQLFTLSADGGFTLVNAGIDLGQSFDSDPTKTSDTYPDEDSPLPPIAGPLGAGSYNFMRVDVNLSVSNGGDEVNALGSARLVPEPETAALVALGMVGLGYVGRRRAS